MANNKENKIGVISSVGEEVPLNYFSTTWIRSTFSNLTFRNSIVSLADQSVVSATNFITGVIIGRACTKEQFGLYILGFSIILIMMEIQCRLILAPYTIYIPKFKDDLKALYSGSTLIHQLFLSLFIVACLGFFTYINLPFKILKELKDVFLSLALTITFILLKDYLRRVFFAQLRMTRALLLDSSVAIILLAGVVLLGKYDALSATRSFLIIGLSCGIFTMVFLIVLRKNFNIQMKEVFSDAIRNWSFGKWLLAGNIAYIASTQLYPWMLAVFRGTSDTGVLAACFGVIFLLNPILLGVANFLGPMAVHTLAQNGIFELRLLVLKSTTLLVIFLGLFCLSIFFFGEKMVVFIYGNNFSGTGLIVFILALSVLASSMTLPIDLSLLALDRPESNLIFNTVALFTTLTIGIWLVKNFGTLGVACSLLINNLTISIVRYVIFSRIFHNLAYLSIKHSR